MIYVIYRKFHNLGEEDARKYRREQHRKLSKFFKTDGTPFTEQELDEWDKNVEMQWQKCLNTPMEQFDDSDDDDEGGDDEEEDERRERRPRKPAFKSNRRDVSKHPRVGRQMSQPFMQQQPMVMMPVPAMQYPAAQYVMMGGDMQRRTKPSKRGRK